MRRSGSDEGGGFRWVRGYSRMILASRSQIFGTFSVGRKNCRCHFSGFRFHAFRKQAAELPPFLLCACDPGCLVKIDAARLFLPLY